jgi:hypothetical protein
VSECTRLAIHEAISCRADHGATTNEMRRLTFFRSAPRGLHVPVRLTPEPVKHEGLHPRANERPRVARSEELAGWRGKALRFFASLS